MKASTKEDIFAAVRAAKSSAEFAAAIGGLKQTLKTLEAERAEAETRRDNAVIDGGDLAALRQRVIDVQAEVATVGATISIAEKRQEEAAKHEEEQDILDLHAEAVRVSADLGQAFQDFDASLLHTRQKHAAVDRLTTKLNSVNDRLESLGRPALRIKAAAVRGDPEPVAVMTGLTRNGQRVDALLRNLGIPDRAVRVTPFGARLNGQGVRREAKVKAGGAA